MEYFSMRIFHHDYYMYKLDHGSDGLRQDNGRDATTNYISQTNIESESEFMNRKIEKLPIVRLFGSTQRGQKVCIHIHDYLPYLYGLFPIKLASPEDKEFLHHFAETIEQALQYKGEEKETGYQKKKSKQIIHTVLVEQKYPCYGFYYKKLYFLKIIVYQPKFVKQIMHLLASGAIYGQIIQPYDAHIDFFLKFYGDANITGLDIVKLSQYKFRVPLPHIDQLHYNKKMFYQQEFDQGIVSINLFENELDYTQLQNDMNLRLWSSDTINPVNVSQIEKTSSCEIEVDSSFFSILNPIQDESFQKNSPKLPPDYKDILFQQPTPRLNLNISNRAAFRETLQAINSQISVTLKEEYKSNSQERRRSFGMNIRRSMSMRDANYEEVKISFMNNHPKRERENLRDEEEVDWLKTLSIENETELGTVSHHHIKEPQYLGKIDEIEEIVEEAEQFSLPSHTHIPQNMANISTPSLSIINKYTDSKGKIQSIHNIENKLNIQNVKSLVNFWKDEHYRRINYGLKPIACSKPYIKADNFPHNQIKHSKIVDIIINILHQPEYLTESIDINIEKNQSLEWKTLDVIDYNILKVLQKKMDNSPEFREKWKEKFIAGYEEKKRKKEEGFVWDELDIEEDMEVVDIMYVYENMFSKMDRVPLNKKKRDILNNMDISHFIKQNETPTSKRAGDTKAIPRGVFLPAQHKQTKRLYVNKPDQKIKNAFKLYNYIPHAPSRKQVKSVIDKKKSMPQYLEVHFSKYSDYKEYKEKIMLESKGRRAGKNVHIYNIEGSAIHIPKLAEHQKSPYYVKLTLHLVTKYNAQKHNIELQPSLKPRVIEYSSRAPTRKHIQKKYSNNFNNNNKSNYVTPIKAKKIEEYKNIRKKKDISPSTEFLRKYLDSQIQNKQRKGKNIFSLHDLYMQLDTINNLIYMVVEIFAPNNKNRISTPYKDPIQIISLIIHNENALISLNENYHDLIFLITTPPKLENEGKSILNNCELEISKESVRLIKAENEIDIFSIFTSLINYFDPDILIGFDVVTDSLGYIAQRANFLKIPYLDLASRTPKAFQTINELYNTPKRDPKHKFRAAFQSSLIQSSKSSKDLDSLFYNLKYPHPAKINGRVILEIYTTVKKDYKYMNYDFENIVFQMFKERIPKFSSQTLHRWLYSNKIFQVYEYITTRLLYVNRILWNIDKISRNCVLSKLYGFEFQSVETRGSQFRVEAILSRVARHSDILLISPTTDQVFYQSSSEITPLVIEPDRQFYTEPVIVLDFQSLYPSVIIAHNLCYTTCLGKLPVLSHQIQPLMQRLGVSEISNRLATLFGIESKTTDEMCKYILQNMIVTPTMNSFVNPYIREGLLPLILREVLETRIMIKDSMKLYPKSSYIYKMLDSRQLGLKMWSNVIYGYTGAGFTGRMPCVDIADSVVSLGRKTLEATIDYISNSSEWENIKVIYGDTDSLFVVAEGRTVKEAILLGEEMARAISKLNPPPMELKFEKVYCPFIALAKKRYAGMKYEQIDQPPVIECKGIETIRRDSCPVVSKIMDKTLRLLFTRGDLSEVKEYLTRQWVKIQVGDINLQDFIFSKPCKMGKYNPGYVGPSAIVVKRKMDKDPCYVPRLKERTRFVIIEGEKGATLRDLAVSPQEFFSEFTTRLNSIYYIYKQVNAALDRILHIFGVNINKWFELMPKHLIKIAQIQDTQNSKLRSNQIIDAYIKQESCLLCGRAATNRVIYIYIYIQLRYVLCASTEKGRCLTCQITVQNIRKNSQRICVAYVENAQE